MINNGAGCHNRAIYYLDTAYGRLYVCAKCALEHPIPTDMRKTPNSDYVVTPADKNCECENIIHFPEEN